MSALARINSSRSPLLYTATAALLVTLIFGAALAIVDRKTVTLVVDGQRTTLTTMSVTVRAALNSAGYEVSGHDAITPAAGVILTDGATITLNRARQVALVVDGKQQQVWTTAATVGDALAQLKIPDDVFASPARPTPLPLQGAALSVTSPHTVLRRSGSC
jgi:resuscitation-promoting factor RpfB